MSYAETSDVEARLGRSLTSDEDDRAEAILMDASAVVDGYCGQSFALPYPAAVTGVVAKMAARSFGRSASGGEFVDQETKGPFSVHYTAAASSGDVWLAAVDKMMLRSFRRGGGMTSVQIVGERYSIDSASDSSSSSS